MPLDKNLLAQLMPLYKTESQELLQTINRDLLALEKERDGDAKSKLMADIFRAAHTLKGSSRAVGLLHIGTLAHSLENTFGRIQRGQLQATTDCFDQIYQALDLIGSLAQTADVDTPPADVSAICAKLESLSSENASAAMVIAPVPQTIEPTPVALEKPEQPLAAMAQPSPATVAAADETVRVAVSKLDALLAQVGELQVARIGGDQLLIRARELLEQMEDWEAAWRHVRPKFRKLLPSFEAAADGNHAGAANRAELAVLFEFLEANESRLRTARTNVSELRRQLEADSRRMAQVTSDLQDDVRRTRMMPAAAVFDTFPRMVRDLAREFGKDVNLVIHGGETEIDRSMLEQIKAPLLHLLRNAVDHGIELPANRTELGKPAAGAITLSAMPRGASIVIQVADDGAGIDSRQVKASAVKKNLITLEQAQTLSDREALWLIFRSGMSTRTTITDISGRGVGMDVVRENVERLQGVIELESEIGQGTRFSLILPLTVATTLCLLAQAGGETLAIPLINIAHIVRVVAEGIGEAQGHTVIHDDGRPVLVASLAEVLGIPSSANSSPKKWAVIVSSADKRAAFLVDALHGAQEVVVKNLPRPFLHVNHVAGAAILGTGQVSVVLNAADLLRSGSRVSGRVTLEPQTTAPTPKATPLILVADDSITTRTLEKNVLEAAGYRVRVVADGLEAWTLLQGNAQALDGGVRLLVSDVNMPRLDGFELTSRIRADDKLKNLPVILVTSLSSREDRERGILVGADAYIVKSSFDQDSLLATVRQLI
ncbi:MAG: hybrid sensor histidine kinase/response regulator [Chloroflexi bacterium]|nr:hybrid sensor histidine kinase/response regulator [Chloroflexota bacterium]